MTVGYAPPEQARNDKRNIDSRADLFGLGITLYECAIGINPFREGARDGREVLQRSESMILPPLNLPIKDSASFRDFIASMTQKRRDHRPADTAEAAIWMNEVCAANGI
jgi:serine/threonine-protein kinase